MEKAPEHWMDEALVEARKGLGLTAPNPPVGALVLKNGEIIGRGFHPGAGKPHAEPLALREAGEAAKGATLVVTLEPCSTTGRTPPCTQAILNAGISQVLTGCEDPNPAHAGRGLDLLRAEGVEVISGIRDAKCRELIRAFSCLQLTGRPWLSLKLAVTLDGRIADAAGKSKWITGPAARERVQALRREADAILVGSATLRGDNPSLLPRPDEGRKPLRLIPDLRGELPLDLQVFSDNSPEQTLCLLGPGVEQERHRALDERGIAWIEAPVKEKRFDFTELFQQLGRMGIQHVLCEGGGQLASSLMKANLVCDLHWAVAPKLLGQDGRPSVGPGWSLDEAPGFELLSEERTGEDLWLNLRSSGAGSVSPESQ